jgi:hypothetical protein
MMVKTFYLQSILTKSNSGHYEGIQPLIAQGKLVDGGQSNLL